MSYTRGSNSQNVGRRTNSNANQNNRSSFLGSQNSSQMTFSESSGRTFQGRNYPITQNGENSWCLSSESAPQKQQSMQNIYSRPSPMISLPRNQSQAMISSMQTPQSGTAAMPQMSVTVQGDNNASTAMPEDFEGNPNVKYIPLSWEDILGGKGGMQGMKISMAPPASGGDGNQNRQLQISFGSPGQGGTNQPSADGSVPLKVISFQPVDNYPGQKTGNSQASGLSQRPATPMPSPARQPQVYGGGGQNYSGMGQSSMGRKYQSQIVQPQSQTQMRQGQLSGIGKPCGNCPACQFKQPQPSYRR